MDPYLEGELWTDVHQRLATAISDVLTAQIAPAYVARLNPYTVVDTDPGEDVGIMLPDVEVLREPHPAYSSAPSATAPSISIPTIGPVEIRIPVIEVRHGKTNKLITAIEILSPVNKRKPGLEPYREKRLRLHKAGVHLLEIDLIRRGERPFQHPMLPKAHYLALLNRAGSGRTDVWAFNIQDPLPVLPVPLKTPDPDAVLDLGAVLRDIYDRTRYDLSINYQEAPPPPALTDAETAWIKENAR